MHLKTAFALAICCAAPTANVAFCTEPATLVPVDTGRQRAVLDEQEVIHLGTARVTHAAMSGDLLAVSTQRATYNGPDQSVSVIPRTGALPRTPWYGVHAVNLYRMKSDGEAELLVSLPQQDLIQDYADGLTAVAAGYDGLRLLKLGTDTDSYLGSEYIAGEECQSVLVDKDRIFTKSGNTIHSYQYTLEPVHEDTAFTYASTGPPDRPKMITDQGFVRCSQIHTIDYHNNYVLRNEVGGLELWEAPALPKSPEGSLTIE